MNVTSVRKSTLRMRTSRLLGLAICFALSGCGSIVITGALSGPETTNGSRNDIAELRTTRGNAQAAGSRRVFSFPGDLSDANDVREASLSAVVRNRPSLRAESYHYLQILSDISGGTQTTNQLVQRNSGNAIYLNTRRGQPTERRTVNRNKQLGSGLLAVVQDNDRFLPWQIEVGSSDCFEIPDISDLADDVVRSNPEADCFDMKTITHELFEILDSKVRPTVAERIPGFSVIESWFRYIPRVIHRGFESTNIANSRRRARGFGFIYTASIQGPLTSYEVYVPINILFLDNLSSYEVVIDPISFLDNERIGPENLSEVYVTSNLIGAPLKGLIKDVLVDQIKLAELPDIPEEFLPGGIALSIEEFLLLAIDIVAGRPILIGQPPILYRGYEVILLPEVETEEGGLDSTTLWDRGRGVNVRERGQVKIVFIE